MSMGHNAPRRAMKSISVLLANFLLLSVLISSTAIASSPNYPFPNADSNVSPTFIKGGAPIVITSSVTDMSAITTTAIADSTATLTTTTTTTTTTTDTTIAIATTTTTATATSNFLIPTSTPTPKNTTSGVNAVGTGNLTLAILTCPPPLILNVNNLNTSTCMGPCCVPCPASSIFYEPAKLETIYTITSVFRAISATACGILAAAYWILPSRREHPHLMVLIFATLMVPWEGVGTLWLYKREKLLCKSVYEITRMTNSWLCAVQGISLQYMVLALLFLGVLLIANLHMLSVYRSFIIQRHLSKLMALSFVLPLASVIPVAIHKDIMNPGFGSICFVGPRLAGKYFFIPMSVLVCFAMLLHLGTITYLITKNIQANASLSSNSQGIHNPNLLTPRQRRLQTAREISGLLKQQWRPGVFALCLVTIDFIYWLFYFMESKKLIDVGPKTPWFNEWLYCLTQQTKASIVSGILSLSNPTPEQIQMAGMEAQKVCASIATPFVPNFAWAALTDMLPAIFGSVVLGIFGSRSELWQDVRRRLFGRKSSGPTYGYGQNGGQGGFGGSKATSDETPRDSNGEKIFQQVPPRPKHGLPNSGPAAVLSPYNSHTALIPEFGSAISKNSLSRNASAESQDPTRLPVNYRQDMPLPWKSNLRPSDSYNNSRSTTPLDNSNNDSRSTTTFGNPINRSRSTTPLGNPNNGSRSATPIVNMNNGSRSATPIDNTRSRSATPFGSNGSRSTTPQNISRVPTPQSNSRPPTPQLKIDTKKPPVSRSDSVIMPEKRFYNTADIEASPISLVTPPPSYNPNSAGIPNYGGSSGRARGSRGPSPVITSPLTKIGYTPYTYSDLDPQLAVVGEASRVQLNYKVSASRQHQLQHMSLSPQRQQRPSLPLTDYKSSQPTLPLPERPRKSVARPTTSIAG